MNQVCTFDPDDPRLSAYALGELDAVQRAEVDALLTRSPGARAMVDGLSATARALEQELASETVPSLSASQRAEIEASARPAQAPRRWLREPRFAAGLAAGVLGGAVLSMVGWRLWRARAEQAPASASTYSLGAQTSTREHLGHLGDLENLPVATVSPTSDKHLGAEPSAEDLELLNSLGYTDDESKVELGVATGRTKAKRELGQYYLASTTDWQPSETGERYAPVEERGFTATHLDSLSTFSIDVDTASYSNVRRMLLAGQLPPPDAVRIEELINYFPYRDPTPEGREPFAARTEVAGCPWEPQHRLLRIGLQARPIQMHERRPLNLVFLIDVSGSMESEDKLPLLRRSMALLVEQLGARDSVALVVYAGDSGLALPPTSGLLQAAILNAIDRLEAGGSTNGGQGIQLAYSVAKESFRTGGLNRVLLCTDGDFNLGTTSTEALTRLIEEQRKSDIFLSVLGFGTGNINDETMELLADKGNGQYAYIDSLAEARKVLVEQAGGTLVPVAKDVKIQVEFNPLEVAAWRLIGYENRALEHRDFADDRKDAGEIGAGLAVTALYELVPAGVPLPSGVEQRLRYQTADKLPTEVAFRGELGFLRLRYKAPEADASQLLEFPMRDAGATFDEASSDLRFASAVAGFGMLLRKSPYTGSLEYADVLRIGGNAQGADSGGYRAEFLELVTRARGLSAR